VDQNEFEPRFERFYRDKTISRVNAYLGRARCAEREVNHLMNLLGHVPWSTLKQGVPVLFHGDLQLDNIIVDHHGDFRLIDWRQDFSGSLESGDLYYDFAKLLASIQVNFRGFIGFSHLSLEPVANHEQLVHVLKTHACEMGLDFDRVRLISSLIYLNMAGLHEPPSCHALYFLGTEMLESVVLSKVG
jgi:thiamine kinase-like enzyme